MYCVFKFNTTTRAILGMYLSVSLPKQLEANEYYAKYNDTNAADKAALDRILSAINKVAYTAGALPSSGREISNANITTAGLTTLDLHARKMPATGSTGAWNAKVPLALERSVRAIGMMRL